MALLPLQVNLMYNVDYLIKCVLYFVILFLCLLRYVMAFNSYYFLSKCNSKMKNGRFFIDTDSNRLGLSVYFCIFCSLTN